MKPITIEPGDIGNCTRITLANWIETLGFDPCQVLEVVIKPDTIKEGSIIIKQFKTDKDGYPIIENDMTVPLDPVAVSVPEYPEVIRKIIQRRSSDKE